MKSKNSKILFAVVSVIVFATTSAEVAAGSCEALKNLQLPDTLVLIAENVTPNPEWKLPPSPLAAKNKHGHPLLRQKPGIITAKESSNNGCSGLFRSMISSGCVSDGPIPAPKTSKSSIIIEENQHAQI